MDFHQEQLQKSCRKRLRTAKGNGRAFSCNTHQTVLLDTFSVDVRMNESDMHPPQFRFACYGITRRSRAAAEKGLPYTSPAICNSFTWYKHTEIDCKVRETVTHFT